MRIEQSAHLWQYIRGFSYAQNYAELYFKSVHDMVKLTCNDCVEFKAWDKQMRGMFNKMHLLRENMVEEYRMLRTYEVSGHLPPYKVRKRKFLALLRKAKHRVRTVYKIAVQKFWAYHDMAA